MQRGYESLRLGLVGAWCPSLGATGYTLLDRSGRNSHGTLTGMGGQANWEASDSGLALRFDGTNDTVLNTAPKYTIGFPFAISAWFYVTSSYRSLQSGSGNAYIAAASLYSGTAQSLFSVATTYSLGGAADKFYYFENNQARVTTNTFLINAWQHVVMSFDTATTVRFFLNGRQGTVEQPGGSFAGLSTTSRAAIGSLDGSLNWFGGLIDDVRFYRRFLTASEVAILASRRGVGLTPQRQRRTSASSKRLYLQVGGTWKETRSYVNVGGTWKEAAVYRSDGTSFKN
jgi:hypothetical protein